MVLLGLMAPLAAGCIRTDDGVAVRTEDVVIPTSVPAQAAPSTQDAGPAAPGVVTTTRAPVPADTVTCPQPPVVPRVTVPTADPQAPSVTIALPDGWSDESISDDGAKLSGPDGMFATVKITQTNLDPAAAFTDYADKMMGVSAVSSVSVLPDELCGYSGQKLMGAWSDTPQQSIEFLDRIVHIWTDTGNYLVAIHVQAPAGTQGFDAASAVLTGDFAVRIP